MAGFEPVRNAYPNVITRMCLALQSVRIQRSIHSKGCANDIGNLVLPVFHGIVGGTFLWRTPTSESVNLATSLASGKGRTNHRAVGLEGGNVVNENNIECAPVRISLVRLTGISPSPASCDVRSHVHPEQDPRNWKQVQIQHTPRRCRRCSMWKK